MVSKKNFLNFENVKVICFGDSTTWGDDGVGNGGKEISWVNIVSRTFNFNEVKNLGVCGSRIAITRDRDDSFVERIDSIDKDADVIILFGGVNDFQHSVPLGDTTSSDTSSFNGALNFMIIKLLERNPSAHIIFITPTKNNFHNPQKPYPTTLQANSLGFKQIDYVKSISKACDFYSVPVINLYSESGISPFIKSQADKYMLDGMHYTAEGYKRIGTRIASELVRIIGFM